MWTTVGMFNDWGTRSDADFYNLYNLIFLAHLSKAQSELLWSPYVRRPSCVVRRVSTFYLNDISS